MALVQLRLTSRVIEIMFMMISLTVPVFSAVRKNQGLWVGLYTSGFPNNQGNDSYGIIIRIQQLYIILVAS